jgi:SAM-dependent methyltransferase
MRRTQPFRMVADEFLNPGVSLRRHFVDDFHFRQIQVLSRGSLVLDLGGNRIGKRGFFDVEQFGLQVVYANLSTAKRPHVQAKAEALPFADSTFAGVICSELLEHVLDPLAVIAEIHRVLSTTGQLIGCVPFLNRIHGDPHDYGRYTDYYWARTLERAGFTGVAIEKQGLFWSVLVDMVRDLACSATTRGMWGKPPLIRWIARVLAAAKRKAVEWDTLSEATQDPWAAGFTTGFGIRATKR